MKQMVRKMTTGILCLLVVVIINFLLPRLMPGDPVLMLTGMDEDAISQAQYESYQEKLGLDRPMGQQFFSYIKALCGGDLGYSYHYKDTVSNIMARRVPNTLQIAIPTVFFSSIIAIVLGCSMGFQKGSKADTLITAGAIVVNGIPGFLLAMIMVTIFSFRLRWFPLGGLNSIHVSERVFLAMLDRVKHLVLPILTLSIASTPAKYLLVRNTMAAAKDEKYVLYARACGFSNNKIKYIHIFKNICQPFMAMLGLNLGFVISGSMICETIFSIKGMGSLIYQATSSRDFPTLQGCLFI